MFDDKKNAKLMSNFFFFLLSSRSKSKCTIVVVGCRSTRPPSQNALKKHSPNFPLPTMTYNFDYHLQNLATQARAKEDARRASHLNPKSKNKRMRAIYKKSLSDMVSSSNTRQYDAAMAEKDLKEKEATQKHLRLVKQMTSFIYSPLQQDVSIHKHSYRDRDSSRELGPENGHVSPQTYVPRAFFWGGGLKDDTRTSTLRSLCSPVNVSSLDPRPATASIVDGGTICGRLSLPPYSPPIVNGGLRQREKYKEVRPVTIDGSGAKRSGAKRSGL